MDDSLVTGNADSSSIAPLEKEEDAKQNLDQNITALPIGENNEDTMDIDDVPVSSDGVHPQHNDMDVVVSKDVKLQTDVDEEPSHFSKDNDEEQQLNASVDTMCHSASPEHRGGIENALPQKTTDGEVQGESERGQDTPTETSSKENKNIVDALPQKITNDEVLGDSERGQGTPTGTSSKENKNIVDIVRPNDEDSEGTNTSSDSEEETKAFSEDNTDSKLEFTPMMMDAAADVTKTPKHSFLLDPDAGEADESGSEEDQTSFMKELDSFYKERSLEFKPPKFYGEPLNLLKLWRAVIRLGGYEQVTSCKLWRQVGESFKPPKTCTTVSWTFRSFYEKALLEYEKHEMNNGELSPPDASLTAPSNSGNQAIGSQSSGRAPRRDSAARAMQGWHSQRLLGNGEVGDPVNKEKNPMPTPKREKNFKSIGVLKRKPPSPVDHGVKVARLKTTKPQVDTMVVDVGPPADWVKINVRKTKDCFEVYALVPGLLREEVRVQSDPMGRLVISGEPEHADNPWGVTPFRKVVSLPSRIDPHQTSAVVTLHGQLFVRVPFEHSDS